MKRHAAALDLSFTLPGGQAAATEGGSSLYLQDAYNDFATGMFQAPGVYIRNDVASGGFRVSGAGPAVLWAPQIGTRDVSLIAKWEPRYRHAEPLRGRPRDGVRRVPLLMSPRTAGKPNQ